MIDPTPGLDGRFYLDSDTLHRVVFNIDHIRKGQTDAISRLFWDSIIDCEGRAEMLDNVRLLPCLSRSGDNNCSLSKSGIACMFPNNRSKYIIYADSLAGRVNIPICMFISNKKAELWTLTPYEKLVEWDSIGSVELVKPKLPPVELKEINKNRTTCFCCEKRLQETAVFLHTIPYCKNCCG